MGGGAVVFAACVYLCQEMDIIEGTADESTTTTLRSLMR